MWSKCARADLALCFCSLVWGSTFVLVKDALADISVILYLTVRFALAAALMAILYWRSIRRMTFREIWAGVQIGFFMLGGYVFQTAGLKFTTPSKAAFITGSSVVLVPILLAGFGRRRINGWSWAGAFSALAGLYFLTVPRAGLGSLNRGDPLVFLCAVSFALHIIFVGRYTVHYSVGALSFLQIATTAVLSTCLIPLASLVGWESPRIAWTPMLASAVLTTSIGSTVIAFSLQVWAQQYTTATHTAVLLSLEPVFAAITSRLVTAERLGARTLLGGVLIFAGILAVELRGPAPAAPESPEPVLPSNASS
jgi:drug/metabolite transporter (DMT)-like permease